MADPREAFPITQISSTCVGIIPEAEQEGSNPTGDYGLIGFSFKDSAGNLVLPQLNANGQLPVVIADGTCLKGTGELAAGSLTIVAVTNADITLAASTTYKEIGFIVSCRRDALFQIIQQDDVTDTVLAEVVLGPGQYTFSEALHCLYITTGATGVQKLKVKAKNFDCESSLRATVTIQTA